MYDSIDDLPFVCRLNLPPAALDVYRRAFNQAWRGKRQHSDRHRAAQAHAWAEVRRQFEREKETGRWIPKAARLEPRVASGTRRDTVAEARETLRRSR